MEGTERGYHSHLEVGFCCCFCLFLLFTKISLIATLFSLALRPTISFERSFFVIWGVLDKVIAVTISMMFFVCF